MALRDVETALEERGAALSALQQQADVTRAQLEEERECTVGKCLKFAQVYFSSPELTFVLCSVLRKAVVEETAAK